MERAEPDQARDTCGPAAATPQRGQPRGPRGEGRDQRTHSAGSTQVGNRASDVLDWGEEPVVLIPPWDGGRIRPRRVRVKILRGRTGPRGGGASGCQVAGHAKLSIECCSHRSSSQRKRDGNNRWDSSDARDRRILSTRGCHMASSWNPCSS